MPLPVKAPVWNLPRRNWPPPGAWCWIIFILCGHGTDATVEGGGRGGQCVVSFHGGSGVGQRWNQIVDASVPSNGVGVIGQGWDDNSLGKFLFWTISFFGPFLMFLDHPNFWPFFFLDHFFFFWTISFSFRYPCPDVHTIGQYLSGENRALVDVSERRKWMIHECTVLLVTWRSNENKTG